MSPSGESMRLGGSLDVSRETSDRLEAYVALLRKWNSKINLVSARSMDTVWERHVADSAQVFRLSQCREGVWGDLGSGGGLPGSVVAIIAADEAPLLRVVLVESDIRKAAFLSEVARECGVAMDVVARRIEEVEPLNAQVISARALAPLSQLLHFARRHVATGGIGLFPKGASVHTEIEAARSEWRFEPRLHASQTNPGSFIVEIGDFKRV